MTIEDHLLAFVAVVAVTDMTVIAQIVTVTMIEIIVIETVETITVIETTQNVTGEGTLSEGMNMSGVVIVIEIPIDPSTQRGILGEGTMKGVGEMLMSIDTPTRDEAEAEVGAGVVASIPVVQIALVLSEMKIKRRQRLFQAIWQS